MVGNGSRVQVPSAFWTRGRRIVERLSHAAEGEISLQFGRRRRDAGIGLGFLLDQFAVAGIPERLVAAVINLGDDYRTAAVSIRHHEPGRYAVGVARLRLRGGV